MSTIAPTTSPFAPRRGRSSVEKPAIVAGMNTPIDRRLEIECATTALLFAHLHDVRLTCAATPVPLPYQSGTLMVRLAHEMVMNAYRAFERGRGGRIGLTFEVVDGQWQLTVEHSRPQLGGSGERLPLWLLQRIADRLGGGVEVPKTIGGMRMIVSATPRPTLSNQGVSSRSRTRDAIRLHRAP